ncbi:sensor histidine kinase [Sphingomonas sp.]|uniref:sensor histidine kinase n=1 Tax=Sphingomonas sp. TaxID=28214 RepID=UPI002C758D1B|nr:histidine kinase dimerization/phosphoacceptor domain -containing protein [Sphingomonas sp.]HTG38868.1 histidine kinase dimerization/phosphoacceptor domain -containing protein [Sphingomonas sp.]
MPTGARVFLILGGALLPLALIALLASLQTTRIADLEARSQLRLALSESARALTAELNGDMNTLHQAMDALALSADDAPACARAMGAFAQQRAAGSQFAIIDKSGRLLCGAPLPPRIAAQSDQAPAARIVGDGLVLSVVGRAEGAVATAYFPRDFLAMTARPGGIVPDHGITLRGDGEGLDLTTLPGIGVLNRIETAGTPLGIDGLVIEMTMRGAPITSPLVVTTLLPLLMWVLAAGIAWFVVDRLLIRPLRRLRASVSAYAPGTVLGPVDYGAVPAQEIRQLGDTFRTLTQTVVAHETGLAEGLLRQTKLTREVHHRVKNNLQVIASLINFHARGATTPEAAAAYASIQRRVDALAVVHRYHFAELEENRGVEMRSVIGELAAGIRAGAPELAHRFSVTIDVEPVSVSQDTAVAVAFLVTELLELAMNVSPETQVRISLRAGDEDARSGTLRLVAPAFIQTPALETLLANRYGRVVTGLARQLRAPLHHDPLAGAYEVALPLMQAD